MSNLLSILRKPLVTEKGTRLQETLNQYVFEVDPNSNKIEIKRAVEKRFDVQVLKVRTLNVGGKLKSLGRFTGRRPDRKKAIITLAEGNSIDFLESA
ncbi:MAG: 50S ribosomal protein L23 [Calditrichaeota bacterium]|jgi:large subunit ribosomal protein L23|nr:50S ribosomal protein L23 [Calditrichota bacterium]MBT7616514.1 50S ribosomal protein L23 [Calditrichota bacterium]MBT7787356.1 50S ribosomal protein L23 [Calditrichota bacterium]